jgi:CubicO group peptidase (beta-lactamase class C family)
MQHRIKSVDDPIFNYLPEYIQFKTALNEKITIRHLLTMSSGIQWDEDVPHNTSENNESQMEKSNDPVAYTLSLPADQIPGKYWNYNSGGVQVLAAIIKTVSGDNIDKFAETYLFTPLGIRNYEWIKSRPDFPAAASGLRLSSRDLLKIGLVYMNDGKWNNIPIIAEDWIKQSLATNILRTTGSKTKGYGYLFWTNTDTVNQRLFDISFASGNGGQRIFMNKESNLIVVITAGNYNKSNIPNDGQRALEKYILPALK